MKKVATVIFGIAVLSIAASAANAQSGTRAAAGGGSLGGSSAGVSSSGGVTTDAGEFGGGLGGGISSGGSRFRDADILTGQAQVIRAAGQANYFNAQGLKEYEKARQIYIENQIKIAEQKQIARALKQSRKAERRAQVAERVRQRELEKAMKVQVASAISWPEALQKQRYAKHRAEIESLAKLYAELEHNDGVAAGLKRSIRNLASQIKKDEKRGFIKDNRSLEVREFVISLDRNHGQLPGHHGPESSKHEMLAKM